jgi:hypothetical protein
MRFPINSHIFLPKISEGVDCAVCAVGYYDEDVYDRVLEIDGSSARKLGNFSYNKVLFSD